MANTTFWIRYGNKTSSIKVGDNVTNVDELLEAIKNSDKFALKNTPTSNLNLAPPTNDVDKFYYVDGEALISNPITQDYMNGDVFEKDLDLSVFIGIKVKAAVRGTNVKSDSYLGGKKSCALVLSVTQEAQQSWSEQILSHKILKGYKNVIEQKMHNLCETNLPFTGRQKEMVQILDPLKQSWDYIIEAKDFDSRFISVPLIWGTLGSGKTRLATEAVQQFNNYLVVKTEKPIAILNIKISEALKTNLVGKDLDQYIGRLFAGRFFFGNDFPAIDSLAQLTIEDFLGWININFQNGIVFLLHFDEFQLMGSDNFREMLRKLREWQNSFLSKRIYLFYFCSGTSRMEQEFKPSKFAPIEILLKGMKKDAFRTLFYDQIGKITDYEVPYYEKVIDVLGTLPRHLEMFLNAKKSHMGGGDIKSNLCSIIDDTAERINLFNKVNRWHELLTGYQDLQAAQGLKLLLINILSGKQVTMQTEINGFTVQKIADYGIIEIKQIKDTDEYKMKFPPITLISLTKVHAFGDATIFNPFSVDTEKDFEETMNKWRVFRNNILRVEGKDVYVSLKKLYPGAIGHNQDLNKEVLLKEIEIVKALKITPPEDEYQVTSIHQYNADEIQISKGAYVNLLSGNYLIQNIPKASSFDAVVFHPGELNPLFEVIQYKSSDHVVNDQVLTSYLSITTGDESITEELKKVTTKGEHKEFYDKKSKCLVVVSNKPVDNFKIMKDNLNKNDGQVFNFPVGAILVSNESFLQYAPPLTYLYSKPEKKK